jgi:hypothetical protein
MVGMTVMMRADQLVAYLAARMVVSMVVLLDNHLVHV